MDLSIFAPGREVFGSAAAFLGRTMIYFSNKILWCNLLSARSLSMREVIQGICQEKGTFERMWIRYMSL